MNTQNSRVTRRTLRSLVVAAGAASIVAASSHAQTSGTWITDVGTIGGNWSDPSHWAGGAIPGGGGTATFRDLATFTAPLTVFQDQSSLTLGGIVFDTFITHTLARPAGNPATVITLSGPAELRHNRPSINGWNTLFNGHIFNIPITGIAGLNKTGPGTVSMTQPNTFTGDVAITDGIVRTTVGDAAFGSAGNSVNLLNGQIRTATAAMVTARTFNITGAATFETVAGSGATFNGPIIGPGSFNKTGSARMDLNAVASNTGAFNVGAGSLVIGGNGVVSGASSIRAVGSVTLDNAATNLADRLNDLAPITFAGSALTLMGSASAASSETIGATTLAGGLTVLTVAPGAGQTATLAAAGVTRQNGGVAFFRGTSLGAPAAPNVARVTMTGVGLVGGGGTAGSTNISVIPWAFGSTNAAAPANDLGNSFVTYSATTGVRPLDTGTEYVSNFFAAGPTDNVRLIAADQVVAPKTVNSLILTGSSLITGSSTLTVTSGAVMNPSFARIDPALAFGAAEGILFAHGSLTLNGPVSGSGGLTKAGGGNATFNNATSTYTGTTTLLGGTNTFVSRVTSGGPGVFGADTSPLVLAAGNFGAVRLEYNGAAGSASFDRDLVNNSANAHGNQALLPRFGVAGNQTLVMNGDIELNFPLAITGGAGGHVILNGNISGGTFLTDIGTPTTITLNGNNTHAGMELLTGTFNVGSDTAFGAGLVKLAGISTTAPSIAAVGGPRTIANDVACLRLGGNYWQIVGNQPITFAGGINLGGSFAHVIDNTALTTYAGVLHTGGFTKGGTGTLVLSGDNVYAGTTTISSGVLRIEHANALGTVAAPTIVHPGATLEITGDALSQEPVTAAGIGVDEAGAIRSRAGNNSLGPVSIAFNAVITVDAGALTVGNVGPGPGFANLTKTADGDLRAGRYRIAALAVDAGTAAVTPGRSTDKTSRLGELAINTPAGARMDLGDNDLVILYSGAPGPLTTVRNDIAAAYNGGAWDGAGLTSSMADASSFALGYGEASTVFGTFPAVFSGIEVDDTTVLVRWTRYGDADLDGTVNLADFNRLAANFGTSNAVWTQGDFDHNGVVNLADFNKLAANFGLGATGPVVAARDWAALAAAVPEPAVTSASVALAGMLRRRRRRRWRGA